MSGLGVEKLEIPKIAMGALGLRNLLVRLGLSRVYDIWEFDGVLNEENRDVVSDDVPITLFSVKFDRETSHYTQ